MSDLLAIIGTAESDEELVDEIARRRPDRVTLLAPEPSDRMARLRARIEQRTGAIVVGIARSREQLRGWRFDREVTARRQPRAKPRPRPAG
jgi:hypothetical protein